MYKRQGYRSEFINDTRGEGTLVRRIKGYTPYKGEITQRANGAMISTETGGAMTYALWNLQERGSLFISPQTEVYEGTVSYTHLDVYKRQEPHPPHFYNPYLHRNC